MAPRKPLPKLPLSAFSPVGSETPADPSPALSTSQPRRTHPARIVDSHVHLWSSELVPHLEASWLSPGHPLHPSQNGNGGVWDLGRYERAVALVGGGPSKHEAENQGVTGLVHVQIEVEHDDADLDGSKGGWDAAIKEVDWLCEHATTANPEAPKVLAVVPWAPVHAGGQAVDLYLTRLLELPSVASYTEHLSKLDRSHLGSGELDSVEGRDVRRGHGFIKGFRYLLQDSPTGTILRPLFIEGLKKLGERGYHFEVTVDCHRRGVERLEEVAEAIGAVHRAQGEAKTRFVICHMGKPDLASQQAVAAERSNSRSFPSHSSYFSTLISLSLFPNVALKLSGLLSESDPATVSCAFRWWSSGHKQRALVAVEGATPTMERAQAGVEWGDAKEERNGREAWKDLKRTVGAVAEPALEAFGDLRLMSGSDFPIFWPHVGSAAPDVDEARAYQFQHELYREALVELGVEGQGLDNVFAENARRWYGL